MPFEVKEGEPLTERIGVRVTAAEKVKLRADADDAGLSVSELVSVAWASAATCWHSAPCHSTSRNRVPWSAANAGY